MDFSIGSDGIGGSLITVQNTPIYSYNFPPVAGDSITDEWILSDGNWVESASAGRTC